MTTPVGHPPRDLRIEEIGPDEVALLRALEPAQRVLRGLRMGRTARAVLAASVSARRPEWSADEVAAEVRRRFAGE